MGHRNFQQVINTAMSTFKRPMWVLMSRQGYRCDKIRLKQAAVLARTQLTMVAERNVVLH